MYLNVLLTFVSYGNLSFQNFKADDFKAFNYIYKLNTPCGVTLFYGHPANTDSC